MHKFIDKKKKQTHNQNKIVTNKQSIQVNKTMQKP